MINKTLIKYLGFLMIFSLILFNCNFEGYCYDDIGSENPEGCYIILAIYNNSSEEIKMRTNLSGILALCQYQIVAL